MPKSAIKFGPFGGLYPRTAARLLPDGAAADAANVNLTSGEIRPIKYSARSFAATNPITTYRAVNELTNGEIWRTWTIDIDIAKVPLAVDVEGRYCWSGDGEPRYTTYTNYNTVASDLALGVPTPTTAVSVSHAGGTGTAATRFYRYTFVTALGEESAPSPVSAEVTGRVDGTWSIGSTTAMQAFPANTGSGTATYSAPSTTFTNSASALHWLRAGDQVVINSVTLDVVSVPTTSSFTVTGNYSAYTSWARKAYWNTTSMYRRLYRTTGSTGTYQLVADNITGTTYSDTLTDAQIEGDDLISDGWVPPPTGLRGLGFLPSGAAFGFVNNLLCFSEPYQAHAWPIAYQLGADYPIVQTRSYGTVVVAATHANPYMADGVEPATATLQKVNTIWPCLAKRSMVAVGDGVLYATSFGLAYIGQAGPSIFTKDFYTEVEWKLLNPESMISALSENRVFIRYQPTNQSPAILLFKLLEQGAPLTTSSVQCDALYADPNDGEAYYLVSDGVYKFDSESGLRIPYSWTSKTYELPMPINWGAAKVAIKRVLSLADENAILAALATNTAANITIVTTYGGNTGIPRGNVNGWYVNYKAVGMGPATYDVSTPETEYVTFNLYYDDDLAVSHLVQDTETFKLPAGTLADMFRIQLLGTAQVLYVKMAETSAGLKAI